MANPYERLIFELAEQKRQNAVQDRMATVYQVWANNGEQKVRLQLGTRPDGSPWLSPWLSTEDHRGGRREEHKYHVGQNVKVSGVGGDMRQATVTPWAENQAHQRPNHATDDEETEQFDTMRETHGRDFHEHWMAQQSAQGQQSTSQTLSDGSTNSQLAAEQQDDVSTAITLIRHGNRPTLARSGQPGSGPAPEANAQPTPKVLAWSKGSRGQNGPPDVNDEIHLQYGDNTKGIFNDGTIVHAVSAGGLASGANSLLGRARGFFSRLFGATDTQTATSPGDGGVGDGSDASTTTITADKIVHRIGTGTVLTLVKNNVTAIVGGGGGGGIMPEMLSGILGGVQSVVSQMTVPLNLPPQTQAAMAAAAFGEVVGNVGAGTQVSVNEGDLLDQIMATVSQDLGGVLPEDVINEIATAIATALETALATYTVTTSSVSTLGAILTPVITGITSELDADQVSAVAIGCAADAVSSTVAGGLSIDLSTSFQTSTENMATLQSGIQTQLASIAGASGMSSSQITQLASSISSLVSGLSGGSVWSLNPNTLAHRTQSDLTQKSANNIGHTAAVTIQNSVGQTRMYAQGDTVVHSVNDLVRSVTHSMGAKIKYGQGAGANTIFVDQYGCWSTMPIQVKQDPIPDGTPLMG